MGPDYKRPELSIPNEFRGPTPDAPAGAESLGDIGWWQIFQDETLQSLIRTALAENYDLRIATSRILDARARVTFNRSFQFPDLSASASAPYTYVPGERVPNQFREVFSPLGTFDMFWEIDFWGRFRRATEAARADLLASESARRFVMTTLVSDVATAYFQLPRARPELEISTRTLASRENSLRLVKLRQQGAVASMIDVRQAEVLLYTAAETVPDIERRIEQTENQISILLGRNPDAVPAAVRCCSSSRFRPSRPGCRRACSSEGRISRMPKASWRRRRLASASPSPTIFRESSSPVPREPAASRSMGAGSARRDCSRSRRSSRLPIFNWGRVGAGVDSASAQAQQALIRYQQTVQQAFRDVADALVEHRKRGESRVQQEALVVSLRDAARLADVRYRGGVTSYLEVLDTERQLFDAELNLARTQRDELLAVVLLYRALGGGWMVEQPPAASAHEQGGETVVVNDRRGGSR